MLADRVKHKSDRHIWVEYREGFFLKLKYITPSEFRRLLKRVTVQEWDKQTHERKERHDDDKYREELASIILDWRGFSPKVQMSLFDMKEAPTEDEPYSPASAHVLIEETYGFMRWLQETVMDIDLFNAYEAAERKKKSEPLSEEV